MKRRWTISTVVLVIWHLFLSSCAGFGAFTFARNVGIDDDLALVAGSVAFACMVTILDRYAGQAKT